MTTLAILGAAHIHTPGFLKRLNDRKTTVRVKAVWDHDSERAEKNAGQLGSTVCADAEAIFSDAEVEAVIICSETDRHEDLVKAAAAAGKAMFVEKPLGLGAQDSLQMAAVIDQARVLFQTGYFMRSTAINRFLKRQITAGAFGKLTRVRCSNCHSGALAGWFDTEWRWMAEPRVAGCGAFGDLGTHALDLLMSLAGDVASATASIGTAIDRYEGCDEFGEGLLRFGNGAVGTMAAGWVDVANPVTLIVAGTEGHAYVCNRQLFFQSKHVEGADGKIPWVPEDEELPHAFELFLDALAGKSVPLVTAHEAAMRTVVMEAMYRGSAEGRWITPTDKL